MIGKCDLCKKEIQMMDEHYYTNTNLFCGECGKNIDPYIPTNGELEGEGIE